MANKIVQLSAYPAMAGASRHTAGRVVIVVNTGDQKHFEQCKIKSGKSCSTCKKFLYRKGSEEDLTNLICLFQSLLGFEWINSETLNSNLMFNEWTHKDKNSDFDLHKCGKCLECLITTRNYTDTDYFVLAISSHGGVDKITNDPYIKLTDGETCDVKDILTLLDHQQLSNVNKILILQACRGMYIESRNFTDRHLRETRYS